MKVLRNLLILLIIAAIAVGAYFGANIYFQKQAVKQIDTMLKDNNLQNDVTYKSVKANLFSRSITVNSVKWYIKSKMNSNEDTYGYVQSKNVIIKGNLNKNYRIEANDLEYINLTPKISPQALNKVIMSAKQYIVTSHKGKDDSTQFDISIKDININTKIFKLTKNYNQQKFEEISKIVKFNNPINITMNYSLFPKKDRLKIRNYSINFINNFGLSYSGDIENININNIKKLTKQMQKQKNNFLIMVNLMSEIFKMKITELAINLDNYGIVERIIAEKAKKEGSTNDKVIDEILAKHKKTEKIYKPLKNFITLKSKRFSINVKNKYKKSLSELFADTQSKNKEQIFNDLEINYSN